MKMHKPILLIVGIILFLVFIMVNKDSKRAPAINEVDNGSQEQTQDIYEESRNKLTTISNNKRVFNYLGWKLYSIGFDKSVEKDDDDCFIDKNTCPYWEKLAEKHNVTVTDIKYVLYVPDLIALSEDHQEIYDNFHKGLDELPEKTDDSSLAYLESFVRKSNLKDYELRAIIARGDQYKAKSFNR